MMTVCSAWVRHTWPECSEDNGHSEIVPPYSSVLRRCADVVVIAERIQWRLASFRAAAAEMREAVHALINELDQDREKFNKLVKKGFFGWLQAVCGALAAALGAAAMCVLAVGGALHTPNIHNLCNMWYS
jgi:hypothetical protein